MRDKTAVAPEHLGSLREICRKFHRGQKTVKGWAKEKDCPIIFDGQSYFVEYNQMMAWLAGRKG